MELSRLRQIINRLRQSGSASADDIQSNEQVVTEIKQELREHKSHASESQTFYRETITKCTDIWKEIEALTAKASLSAEEEEELATKKHVFTLILVLIISNRNLFHTGGIQPSLDQLTTSKRRHMTCLVSWTIGTASNTSRYLMKGLVQKIRTIPSLSSKAILTRSLSFTRGLEGFFCS